MSKTVKQLKHPYIKITKKIRGGDPVISGTSIRVMDIVIRYEVMGMSPDEIIVAYPHLSLSQVHDALSYFYEHKSHIDKKWRDAIKDTEAVKKMHPSILEKKIGKVKDIYR